MRVFGHAAWMWSLVFLCLFSVYLRTSSTEVFTADSGELTTSGSVLGIPHPTGYAGYNTLIHAFSVLIPLSNIAHRVALFSAVAGALAVTIMMMWIRYGIGWKEAFLIPVIAGLSPTLWSQGVIQEVYSLHFLLLVLLLGAAHRCVRSVRIRDYMSLGFLVGLATTHHLLAVFALPGVLIMLVSRGNPLPARLRFGSIVLFSLLSAAIELYFPIRSVEYCAFRWIPMHEWKGFLFHVSGSQFRSVMFGIGLEDVWGNFLGLLRKLIANWPFPLLILAVPGAVISCKNDRRLFWGMTISVISVLVFILNYRIIDIEVYYLQVYLFVIIWISIGFGMVFRALLKSRRFGAVSIGVIWLGLAFFMLIRQYHPNDRSTNTVAYDYGISVLQSLDPDSILVTQGWSSPFIFTYFENVMQFRPDVRIVVDYKGRVFFDAMHQQWSVPVMTTVPVELPNMERAIFVPEGYVYRFFSQPPAEPARDRWNFIRTHRLLHPSGALDFHSRALIAEYYYHRAEWSMDRGDPVSGDDMLKRAEAMAFDNNLVLNNLSAICFKRGDLERAQRYAEKSLALDSEFYQAHHNLGNIFMRRGEYERALPHYLKAKDQQIALGRAHQTLGLVYLREGEFDQAIEELSAALRYHRNSWEVRYNLATAYIHNQQPEEAIEILVILSEEMPDHAAIWSALGSAYSASGQEIHALEALNRAAILSDSIVTEINRAVVLAEQGHYPEAIEAFERLERRSPDNPVILNNRALLSIQCGDQDTAMSLWKRSLMINPKQPAVIRIVRSLGLQRTDLEGIPGLVIPPD